MKPIKVRRAKEIAYALPPPAVSIARLIIGLVFAMICLAASMMLVLQHFGLVDLPGCGPQSECAAIATGEWGDILGWPVSFLGLAYFTALVAAWAFTTRSGVSMTLRATVRLGVVVSLVFSSLMLLEQKFCTYCLVIHVSNIVFWVIVERSPRAIMRQPSAIIAVSGGFVLVTALLTVAVSEQQRLATEVAARESHASIDPAGVENGSSPVLASKLEQPGLPTLAAPGSDLDDVAADDVRETSKDGEAEVATAKDAEVKVAEDKVDDADPKVAANTPVTQPASTPEKMDGQSGPAARQPYRIGPENATAKLVVFYDYQDAQCQRIERELRSLLAKYGKTMSVTARHYPLCAECNFSINSTTHPNACRAALAAEAAGILKGNDGFWKMHRWLLDHGGTFTDDELKEGLVELGYDEVDPFLATMSRPQTLAGVLADIVEARTLQVGGTPEVLLNGELLAGLRQGTGLIDALRAAAKKRVNSLAKPAPKRTAPSSPLDPSLSDAFSPQLQFAASSSTVRIVNSVGQSLGSGTIIALRDPFVYVLTAYHVVQETKRVEVRTFSMESYPEPSAVYSFATVIASSKSADLALLRFSSREEISEQLQIVPLDLVPPESSFPAFTIGCDGQESAPTCRATDVLNKKRVRRTVGGPAVTVWEVALESAAGRSGGPLVDRRGLVLGVASGVSEGKGYFCHAEEIHRFFEQNGLQGLLTPSKTSAEK